MSSFDSLKKGFLKCLLVVAVVYISTPVFVWLQMRATFVDPRVQSIQAYRIRARHAATRPRVCSSKQYDNSHLIHSCLKRNSTKHSYPVDAQEHVYELRRALAEFSQISIHKPHYQTGYKGPWIENYWITHFEGLLDESDVCLQDIFGPFIPLFIPWEDIYVNKVGMYPSKLVETLHALLRPEVNYVTVSQRDEGLSKILPPDKFPNILVLSAGGFGHVPIPLLKQPEKRRNRRHLRRNFCSFVGTLGHAPDELRERMNKLLGKNEDIDYRYYYGPKWRDVMEDSSFQLVPRGVGRSSFHLAETIQMGLIPIYVYSDAAWIPYKDLFLEHIGYASTLDKLPDLLVSLQYDMTKQDMKHKEKQIARYARSHFTPQGIMKQIHAYLVGEDSDLKCQDLPLDPIDSHNAVQRL